MSHTATQTTTEGNRPLTDLELSAAEQVSMEVEQKVRGNEPVLCPPYCYAAVVGGSALAGYGATKAAAGGSAHGDFETAHTERRTEELDSASVNELLQVREEGN